MSPVPWQTGHIIQAQYLNSLQELLSDWSDNALLVATGAAVAINATPSAPAAVVVDGYMRNNTADEVANISGPSGVYNIFATANRSTGGFDLTATLTQVTAAHSRLMGTADFNGVSVTDVETDVREVNVSHLEGREPYENSTGEGIPAGRPDATLDPAWIDDVEYNMVPVGGVRELWVPSGVNAASQVPSGWALLNGQLLGPTEHAFPAVATITLPNMKNRMSLGANPNNVYGTVGDDSGTAPGVGGTGGSMETRNLSHHHGVNNHSHSVDSHQHNANHRHDLNAHRHNVDLDPHRVRFATMTSSVLLQTASTDTLVATGAGVEISPDPLNDLGSTLRTNITALTTGAAGNTTDSDNSSVATTTIATSDLTPWNSAVVYMMRVL